MPTVLLAGAYGQGNPGDEALLDAIVRALPEWDVVATSSDPDDTIARHGCLAVPARGGEVMRVLRRSDALVVGGGTVFKQLHPVSGRRANSLLERTAGALLAARATGQPTALVGVGASAMVGSRARTLARLVVRSADLLVLRDEESAGALLAAGATPPFRVGADLSWTTVAADVPAPAVGAGEVVVVPSVFAAGDAEALVEQLVAGLDPIAAAGVPIAVLPWQVGCDIDERLVAEVVARRLGARLLAVPTDLARAQEVLAGASLVVGLRFHSLVAAAAAGVPFVAVAHERKLRALARRLGQPVVAVADGPEALAAAVLAEEHHPPAPAAVRGEVLRANETIKLLQLLLGTRGDDPGVFADVPLFPEVSAR